jgi:glucans biosynthesis protein C
LSFLKSGFPLTHLWFLYYLLLVYSVCLGVRAAFLSAFSRIENWTSKGDRVLKWLVEGNWTIPVAGGLTWLLLLPMRTWSVDTPDRSFLPHLPALALFGLCFSVGWWLHRQASLLEIIRRRWWVYLVCAVLASLPGLGLASFEGETSHPHFRLYRSLFFLAYAGMMWSWILTLLGMFLRFFERENRYWRYLSDSSYWLYILHLPIVTILQVAVARLPWPCGVKFGAICILSLPLLLASYHFLVRSTVVGWVLNGRRYPFRWGVG